MLDILKTIIYFPLLNALVFLYNYIPDIGVVIILLTLLTRIILAPSHHKSIKSQQAMTSLQPKLNELREKFKDDKEAQAREMMNLYKENKVNPFSSCLPLLIQLPILIGLFYVFRDGLNNHLSGIYSFVHAPETINPLFLNLIDLSKMPVTGGAWYMLNGQWYLPGLVLALITGLAQFWQSKLMAPKKTANQDFTQSYMTTMTVYFMPLMITYIAFRFPTGLSLYWVITALFAVAQHYYMLRKHPEFKPKAN